MSVEHDSRDERGKHEQLAEAEAAVEEASEAFFAGLKTYHVTVETIDRTTYAVEATNAEDAEQRWYENTDQPVVFNRVLDSTVVSCITAP